MAMGKFGSERLGTHAHKTIVERNLVRAVTALPRAQVKDKWDIFTSSPPVPGPEESLEAIAATPEENTCTFRA